MPGTLVHLGAQVMCVHGGQATPAAPVPRVTVSGEPVATIASPWLVAGCGMPPPPTGTGPCVSAQFVTAATRVLVEGVPVLLLDSQSVCVPTGTPLLIVATQPRVTAI